MKLAAEIGDAIVDKPMPDLMATYQVSPNKSVTDFIEEWRTRIIQYGSDANEIPDCTPTE